MSSTLPPGPREPRPLQGLKFMRRPADLMEAAHERYGDVWTLRMPGGVTNVIVADPALIKEVFDADPAVVGGAAPPMAKAMLGEHSLILLDGAEHATQRSLMAPAFHRERVQRYREEMARNCERELVDWPLGEPLQLLPRMERITLRSIMSALFGPGDDASRESLRLLMHEAVEYSTNVRRLARVWFAMMRDATLPASFRRLRERVDAAVFREIERARQDPRLEEREDILATLLRGRDAEGNPISDSELRDQVVTLLFQGHTSTASGLAWALERLMRHPEVFERLRAEAQAGSDEYVDAVVKEALRVRPPLPFPTRSVTQPFRLGEYELEPGTQIMVNSYMLHRRPDLYPEPERFRPERFLEKPADASSWTPFGGGKRGCPAASFALLELKVVLLTIAQRARLAPADQADEEIRRRAVGFIPSRGALAVLQERVPAAGVADVAAG
jgi:cytochrome P450